MNYPIRDAVIAYVRDGDCGKIPRRYGDTPKVPEMRLDDVMNFLGTHDTERILTILGGEATGESPTRTLRS